MNGDSIHLHCAPWVVPVSQPPINDGGVATSQGTILAVGERQELLRRYPQAECRAYPTSVLTPALINGHIHLELSHLAELATAPFKTSFTGWITRLLELRDALGATGEQVEQAALETARRQYRSGVSVLADIGNTPVGRSLAASFPGELLAFTEYLGLAERTLPKNLDRLNHESDAALCTGHAPYSTHPRLLQRLKERAVALDRVFPVHVAEPAAEGEMIRQGRGEIVDFIRKRGFWDGSFTPTGQGGSIQYLYDLGVLDHRTLCVHAIHVLSEEIRIMAGEGVKVCLCPGSNQFLRTGTAPVRTYLDHGILPALGTDSLASNPELSLWREMGILAEQHPDVEADEIFRMATQGGAEALGLGHRFGSLEPGKAADLLAVPVSETPSNNEQVYRILVRAGSSVEPIRILQ